MPEQRWERLIQVRKAHGMSQEDAAKACDVGVMTWSRWERGATIPDAATLKKMSQIFKVSIDYLLENDEFVMFSPEQTIVLSQAADILKSKFN
ncbi:MAG: helix-turn-helix transcriptional regulator [Bacilli bacterium]|nr:helix-turn-helix transcriptional regulator [Bacilli bacterium]